MVKKLYELHENLVAKKQKVTWRGTYFLQLRGHLDRGDTGVSRGWSDRISANPLFLEATRIKFMKITAEYVGLKTSRWIFASCSGDASVSVIGCGESLRGRQAYRRTTASPSRHCLDASLYSQ